MKQEEKEEIKKCAEDPVYFAEKYFKVKLPGGKIKPLELSDREKQEIRKLSSLKGKSIILTKTRRNYK